MRLSYSSLSRAACVLLGLSVMFPLYAQTKPAATGVITGRVMIGEKPAVGVPVGLVRIDNSNPFAAAATIAKDATDTDGKYRLAQVPAGNFRVTPFAPGYISTTDSPGFYEQGKSVQMREGDTIDNLDFSLLRGGVVTGKVLDISGKPLIEQRLSVWKLEQGGRKNSWNPALVGPYMLSTDDRGAYRLYGLPEGRYLISAGTTGTSALSNQRGLTYKRMFYPDATEEAQAKPIEVTPGSETKDIDFRLSVENVKGNSVMVRVVDAETNAPIVGAMVGFGALQGERMMGTIMVITTDARGVGRLDGLQPGRYGLTLRNGSTASEYFSEQVTFEMHDSDVEGVEIRAQRGATLSGKALLEGINDPALLAKMAELRLSAHTRPIPRDNAPAAPMQVFSSGFRLNPDGSFRVSGLAPGRVFFNASGIGNQPIAFSLLRVELEGVFQKEGVEVSAGQQVSNIRLVFGYGQASVRGQVQIVGGTLPDGARVSVSARRTDGQNLSSKFAQVDARGRFTLESLVPGEYDLMLTASPRMIVAQGPDGNFGTSNAPAPGLPRTVTQKIIVPQIGEVPVSITLDLTPKEK